ncbi:hypothetical protein D791_03043 [Nitrincola nitratireducens]|uniref:Uncharacterized protein n=1 Tax=Nitrincola nitratireducens TaxID=1229521 RepID=W9VHG1_9GAMM|nr:hypothetical protein D791_03043 [Nitrincola nitratireducens]
MAVTVECEIVSAEEEIFRGKVEFVSVTGSWVTWVLCPVTLRY